MSLATSAEQIAVCDAISAWATRRRTTDIVRAELEKPRDHWRDLFPELAELGVFAAVLDEAQGGIGASFVDTAAMVEQCGAGLVPGPVAETVVAALALSMSTDSRAAGARESLVAGEASAVIPALTRAGGAAVVTGGCVDLGSVVGYVDGSVILAELAGEGLDEGWYVIPAEAGVREAAPAQGLDGRGSVSRLRVVGLGVDDLLALDDGDVIAGALSATTAAYASGVTRWVLDTAVEYATVRTQFGVPIGSFQAVKHICADMLCRSEQVTAAAWDLAAAVDAALAAPPGDPEGDTAREQLAFSRLAADVLVASLPVASAEDCIQVLGGIGFTFEHDAHLYLRTALALRAATAATSTQRAQLGRLGILGRRRHFELDLSAVEHRRDAIRADIDDIAAAAPAAKRAMMVESGYLTPHWPSPYGLGADPALQLLIDAEFERAGVERPDLVIGAWAIPTILEHGTPEQRARFVRPTLDGDIVWCQLFSEPEAGSDLASLRTRAVRADGGWRLSGQKIWTSQAHNAQWGICLARTDPEAPKHKGITYFLVDMSATGIDIRPLRELSGQANFNEVFLDDVFVPDECVVGEVNGGWRLARTTLANERVAMGGSGLGKEMDALLAQIGSMERELTDDELRRLGELVADAHVGRVLDALAVTRRLAGHDPGAVSSVRKLIGVAHRQSVPEFGLDLLGVDGVAAGEASEQLLQNRCLSIAGGTTQILRTAAAERILGLPRG
ncbi:acyl-CoA dehydrogenase [Gordonia aichiensis]|uniref:Acyl-CoA dehydrogenase n=1 Tax=Gordonia aichiensis NBRC 108223 TaxID=1220583 RepID=L7KHC9_9ACTN|nr:acyl-CoA dehydrogenase [Gordonia aichiensis]GAC47999.1 hypothetical protein GOACH_04_03970 [Gordonia aichiensis NBRC 108223]